MARMSMETRRRVIYFHRRGLKLKDIQIRLKEEEIFVSKTSLCLLIKKYKTLGIIADKLRPNSIRKLKLEHLRLIDDTLANDDESSTTELRAKLLEVGVDVSRSTIQRAKRHLGWLVLYLCVRCSKL